METACGRGNGNVRDADLGDARRLFCLLAIDILENLASMDLHFFKILPLPAEI